ncbi:hypothetical protein MNBD_GAMMA12-1360 [hydrothermal vent metagenome]|uniref:Uncharacterized protein n=1 Tax=hydrothermal vent metagenome TaxID=652676 RepID=A0A3B0YNF2_9ZZZZ
MTIIKQLLRWLNSYLFYPENKKVKNKDAQHLPPIKFNFINIVERPPKNSDVKKDSIYLVTKGQNHKWVLFQCPCGCGHVITLSLQLTHSPHWKITKNSSQRPTLYPSVWQDTSCCSHFWLKDGRIYWCQDTGTPPSQSINQKE